MTQRTAVVIAHPRVGAELGHVGEWLADNGFDVRRIVRDEVPAPDAADDADLVIVMGSTWTMARTMDASDDPPHAADAIAAEIALIRRCVEREQPLLGICFGGQVLSHALGGSVTRQPVAHIGCETPSTRMEELDAPWMLLHNDAFTVPPGAELLAEADHAPIAFRYGRAWAVQFHPEVDAGILARMFDDVGASPQVSAPHVADVSARADEHRAQTLRLLDRFWAEVS
jgi:GMP synthase (glutamine-hydrolysing)